MPGGGGVVSHGTSFVRGGRMRQQYVGLENVTTDGGGFITSALGEE